MSSTKISESQIEESILEFLNISGCVAWKNNTGGRKRNAKNKGSG